MLASRLAGPSRPQALCGQALVWFLATLATCVVVLYGVFNLSQVTIAKQHVVNATDAGALAGATQQARLLNFMAYGNRAMVATDVLAAQMVSLDAWLRYVGTGSQNVGTVSQAIPYVGQVIGQVLNTLSQAVERVEVPYGTQILPAAITAFEGLKQAVGGANELAHQSGATLANQTAGHVVAAHRVNADGMGPLHSAPQLPSSAALTGGMHLANEQAWRAFSSRYAGAVRQRTREVVLAGLDDFTASRDGNALTNLGTPLARLEKRGGTRLLGFERWEAQDTWDLRFRSWSWRRGWQWNDSTVPVGWGRADVGGGGHLRWGNTTAQRLAFDNRRDIADHTPPRWSGISTVRDLSASARARLQPELSFVLVAAQPRAALSTTLTMGLSAQASASPLGLTHLPERLLADQVSAVSVARVYFERPQRGVGDWTAQGGGGQPGLVREDGAKEHASLYNPFWQARLAPVEPAQRAALLTAWGAPHMAVPAVLEALP